MASTPILHFFCGKAGAGQTTVVSAVAQEHKVILLSEDISLLELYGDQMQTFDDYIRVAKKLKAVVGPLAVHLHQTGPGVLPSSPAWLER